MGGRGRDIDVDTAHMRIVVVPAPQGRGADLSQRARMQSGLLEYEYAELNSRLTPNLGKDVNFGNGIPGFSPDPCMVFLPFESANTESSMFAEFSER